MGRHVVSPGGIECFPVLLLEVLSCPFPLYSVRVDGGEATCHRLTFFFFFFLFPTLKNILISIFILLIFNLCP